MKIPLASTVSGNLILKLLMKIFLKFVNYGIVCGKLQYVPVQRYQ